MRSGTAAVDGWATYAEHTARCTGRLQGNIQSDHRLSGSVHHPFALCRERERERERESSKHTTERHVSATIYTNERDREWYINGMPPKCTKLLPLYKLCFAACFLSLSLSFNLKSRSRFIECCCRCSLIVERHCGDAEKCFKPLIKLSKLTKL